MNDFEDQLRDVLRPVDPPTGFASRVAGLAGAKVARPSRREPRQGAPWAAIAAGLALMFGGLEYRYYQRGVEARENLIQALQITASAVAFTQQSLKTYQEAP